MYISTMSKAERSYVVGARPPQEVSGKAQKQLASAKTSRRAMTLVAKASAAKVTVCSGTYVTTKCDGTPFKGVRKEK